ncbi:hypothetical protein LguiB_012602 [Lonicera macranthoides]
MHIPSMVNLVTFTTALAKVLVVASETNLLRIINYALYQELFFTITNQKLTVVGADTSYVKPFTADQPLARYYIAARAYASAQGAPFNNTTTIAILEYRTPSCSGKCASTKLVLASLPPFNDISIATAFNKSFRSPRKVPILTNIDENLFITIGLTLQHFIL